MPRVTHVKRARRGDRTCRRCGVTINAGDSYYRYKFRNSSPYAHCAQHPPGRRDLTQSAFYATMYDLEDALDAITSPDDVDSLIGDIDSLRDETQDSLDNMPDSLQSGPTGELLQERIDGLDTWVQELEEAKEPDEGEGEDEHLERIRECRPEVP